MSPSELARVEVLHPGALTTIQDLGRPGYAHLGIARSGAADRRSLRIANALVGNSEACACLETTLVGPRLRLPSGCVFALTGAEVTATLDGDPVAMNKAVTAAAAGTLKLGSARRGLRTYVAFRGGIGSEPVLESRSSDLRSAIGPGRLAAGDSLVLSTPDGNPGAAVEPEPLPDAPTLRVLLGPREDHFTGNALQSLCAQRYEVSPHSDRVGVRLQGIELTRVSSDELRSEGIVPGAIQVPPDGQPIIMLADHPTTGGYPVIAVVQSSDLWLVGQLRPGQSLRFSR